MGATVTVLHGLDDRVRRPGLLGEKWAHRAGSADPRIFQILFLGVLLAAGAWLRDFSIRPTQIVLTFASALGTQHVLSRMFGRLPISYRSAFITALSLTLLLRADTMWAHPLAAIAPI